MADPKFPLPRLSVLMVRHAEGLADFAETWWAERST